MIEYFQVMEFEKGHLLSSPLSIFKAAIKKSADAFGDWIKYESEGYLDGLEAIVLLIRVSVPSRSPYGILDDERMAICYLDQHLPLLKACALRKDFPDLPHLNQTHRGKPRELCLFDVHFMDEAYNQNFIEFVLRVKNWLDRAAVGKLHLDEQPMEPFLMSSAGDFVLDKETYDRVVNTESNFEIYSTHFIEPNGSTSRLYIEVTSKGKVTTKNPFAILCIKSQPSSSQCISHTPLNYMELHDLLLQKVSIDLDKAIHQFIRDFYRKKDKGEAYLEKHLILVLCIPRLNLKGELTKPEIVAFGLHKKLLELAIAIGCLRKQDRKKEKGHIYVLQDDFDRKEDELKEIQVDSFKVIRPFTKKLAMDMASISENVSSTSFSVIGLGALGSQVVLNLSRQGISDWKLVDEDTLLPHNFARHALSVLYRGTSKAVALKDEIKRTLEEAKVKDYSAKFGGFFDKKIEKIFDTDIILDCSASYSVLFSLAYRVRPAARTISAYYCGNGYTSVLICEDSERRVRLDDIDLQLKVKGLQNRLIKTIYKTGDKNQLIYSTSCSSTTTVIAQDLVAIHAGIISRQIKKVIDESGAKAFINLIQEDEFGVECENFVPSEMIVQDSGEWQFRISRDSLDEMVRCRNNKLPNETGGVLIGWINSFKKIVYVGMALSSPPDSVERPYYFQRGKKGLYEQVRRITQISNGDLYYIGEWHSHPPNSSTAQSGRDIKSMEKIPELMLEVGLPGILLIVGDSNTIGCHVACGWGDQL